MEDSAIKYVFSNDGLDKTGLQFYRVMQKGHDALKAFVAYKNFTPNPELDKFCINEHKLHDNSIHPEILQFLTRLGMYHGLVFSSSDDASKPVGEELEASGSQAGEELEASGSQAGEEHGEEEQGEEEQGEGMLASHGGACQRGGDGVPSLAQLDDPTKRHTGRHLWNKVIKVFKTISDPEVITFYTNYVNIVLIADSATSIELEHFDPSRVDLNTLRLNLKKQSKNKPKPFETRFALNIPKISLLKTPVCEYGIIFNATGRQMITDMGDDGNLLPMYYKVAYSFGSHINKGEHLGNGRVGFYIDLVQFITNAMKQIIDSDGTDETDLTPSTLLDFATNDIISVKNGKFVRKDGSREIPITLTKSNCYSTQFKGPPHECTRLISDLIFNEDARAFDKYFNHYEDSWFANIARDEIGRINPKIAVSILKRFGFSTYNVPYSGRSLTKFESLSSWMKKLKDAKISPATLRAIQSATHLKTYLSQLVSFVNGNPVILNSGIDDALPEPDQLDSDSYLGRTGIKMGPPIPLDPIGWNVGDKHTVLRKLAENTRIAHQLMFRPNSTPFPFQMMQMPMGMGLVGGGQTNGSATLGPIIRSLITDLNRKGKKLRQSDKDQIEGHLSMLEKLEKSLVNVSHQLSEFKDWVSIFPDNTNQKVSLGTIESSIDKYRQCVANHANLELGLINVAMKLCEQ
jgi:hypothetical protein